MMKFGLVDNIVEFTRGERIVVVKARTADTGRYTGDNR